MPGTHIPEAGCLGEKGENMRKETKVKFSEHPRRGRLSFIMGMMLGVTIGIIIAGLMK